MTRWLRAHPVAGFILLAFGVSYLVGMPLLMFGNGMIPARSSLAHGYLPRIGVTYGPAIAALVLAHLSGGPGGVARLLRSALPTRRDLPWAVGIIVVGMTLAAIAFLVAGVGRAELLGVVRAHGGLLVAHLVLQLVVVALGEELGWRGWLLPTLADRTTRLRATLIVAAVWGLWHWPLLLNGFVAGTMLLLGALGLSIIFTALWAGMERRLFTVVLAHATVNAPLFFMEQVVPARGAGDGRLVTAWQLLEGTYAVAALVFVVATWRWWMGRELHVNGRRGREGSTATAVPSTA